LCGQMTRNGLLEFLKGQVMAFVLFLTVFLSDAALPEMIDDLGDMESADVAIVRNSDTLLLMIQSNLHIVPWSHFSISCSFSTSIWVVYLHDAIGL
jgi:hypothetical protein